MTAVGRRCTASTGSGTCSPSPAMGRRASIDPAAAHHAARRAPTSSSIIPCCPSVSTWQNCSAFPRSSPIRCPRWSRPGSSRPRPGPAACRGAQPPVLPGGAPVRRVGPPLRSSAGGGTCSGCAPAGPGRPAPRGRRRPGAGAARVQHPRCTAARRLASHRPRHRLLASAAAAARQDAAAPAGRVPRRRRSGRLRRLRQHARPRPGRLAEALVTAAARDGLRAVVASPSPALRRLGPPAGSWSSGRHRMTGCSPACEPSCTTAAPGPPAPPWLRAGRRSSGRSASTSTSGPAG